MRLKIIDYGYKNLPKRAHHNDAGADVYARLCSPGHVTINPHETVKIPLGLGLCLPDGYAAFVFPRSGLSSSGITCELPPIDSGYRGEIHAIVTNCSNEPFEVWDGDRIGQLVVFPIAIVEFETGELDERGTGAFGSTGK